MTPRKKSETFRLLAIATAMAVFIASAGRLAASGSPDWPVALSLVVVGLAALYFPLHVALSEKVSVAASVFFAAALLLPAWQAAVLAGVTQAINTAASAIRKARSTREMPPMRAVGNSLLFNAAQSYLSVLAAGLVLETGGVSASSGITRPWSVVVLAVAGVAMYVVNLMLVSTASALATGRNPIRVFSNTQRVISAQFACLYTVGAATAFAAVRFPWLVLLASVTVFLAHRSIRNRIELKRKGVLAVERMAEEVDARDPYTFQHSQRVAMYSHAIGRKLGFNATEIELLELAAKVHDIGKIRIPDSVLLKPDQLTPEERRVMEEHPRLGFEILSRFSEYARVLELVLTHHERYDGGGYPNGIVGRRLLMIAQVIPVADSLDAMTTARPYRRAVGWDAALGELKRGAGSQWNPQVVAAALGALERHSEEGDVRPLQRSRRRGMFAHDQVRIA